MKTLAIGSYSSGTMRPEDLIPCFMDALREVATRDDLKFLRDARARRDEYGYHETEDASFDLDELFVRLDAHCPPYCYFGASDGGGADYGCWVSWDVLEEDRKSGEIWVRDDRWKADANKGDYPKGYTGMYLAVSDHGNATLYKVTRGRAREIWGIM